MRVKITVSNPPTRAAALLRFSAIAWHLLAALSCTFDEASEQGRLTGSADSDSTLSEAFPLRNLIVGACELTHSVADISACNGWDELYACVAEHCELAACKKICANHIACAADATDRCDLAERCPKTPACDTCVLSVEACGIAPCESMFRCATPSAAGACSRLGACCMSQANPVACSTWQDRAARILGDPGCQDFLDDPGFLKAYANDPPCTPQ